MKFTHHPPGTEAVCERLEVLIEELVKLRADTRALRKNANLNRLEVTEAIKALHYAIVVNRVRD